MLLPRLVHVKWKHSWSLSFIYKDQVWWAQIVVDSFPQKNRDRIWVKSYPLDTCIFRISVIVAIYMYHNRLEPYNDILWCTLYRYTTGGTVSTQYRYIKYTIHGTCKCSLYIRFRNLRPSLEDCQMSTGVFTYLKVLLFVWFQMKEMQSRRRHLPNGSTSISWRYASWQTKTRQLV